MKKKNLIISFLLILLSISFIGIGLYLNKIKTPSYIIGKSLDHIKDTINNYFLKETNIEDNFSFEISNKYNLKANSQDKELSKIINNLNQLSSHTTIIHNKDYNQLFFSTEQKIKEENLLLSKLLIENSTEYLYLDEINHYIDNGNNTYFESFQNKASLKDNINYLYNSFFSSLKKSLKDDYFYLKEKKEQIDGINKDTLELSIEINDNLLHKIINDTLETMKKDKRTNQLLSSIYKDFNQLKLDSSKELIKSNTSYKISLSLIKSSLKPYKYQLDISQNNNKKSYIYKEENNNKDNFYYLLNNQIIYVMDTILDNDYISISIYNSSKKLLGEFQYEKKEKDSLINYTFDNESILHELTYTSTIDNYKNNNEYDKNISINLKMKEDSIKIEGDITSTIQVRNNTRIDEEINDIVLYSKLTEEEKKLINNKWFNIIERLKK